MSNFRIIALFLFCTILQNAYAEPISGKELFVNPLVNHLRLSPNGQLLTTVTIEKEQRFIELMDLTTYQIVDRVNLGFKYQLLGYYWLNDSTLFFNFRNQGVSQSLIAQVQNKKVSKLTQIKTAGSLVSDLPDQPDHVLFQKPTRSGSQYRDLYTIFIADLISNDFTRAQKTPHNDPTVRNYFYDRNFERIITNNYDESSESVVVKYMPVSGGEWTHLLTLKDTESAFVPAGFLDPYTLAVLTNQDSDKITLRKYNISQAAMGEVIYQHSNYDLSSATFSKQGELEYVTYYEHGLLRQKYFDTNKARFIDRLKKTFNNQEASIIDSASNGTDLLYVNGSIQPGEYFLYNRNSGTVNRLLLSYPHLEKYTFAPSQQIKIRSNDGATIEAFLTTPIGSLNHRTLLVMPHGGPIDVQESDRFNKEVQYYASRGFSVLRVNFRGSSGYGKAFLEQGVGEFGKLIESDITAAVNRVTSNSDFKYICSIGASYGGYSATMLAIKNPAKYNCVVGAYGIYDLSLLYNTSNYRSGESYREQMARTVGSYDQNLIRVSPVYRASDLKVPILLIAGRDDDIADFEHTNRFHYVLERNKHPVETMFYRDTGHGHTNWVGDRHEAAVASDFLMRSLRLQYPDQRNLSARGRSAIADDFAIIAEGFSEEDIVDDDKTRANVYYQKASEFGHKK